MPINIYAFSGVRYSKLKNQKIPRISFAVSELIRIFAAKLHAYDRKRTQFVSTHKSRGTNRRDAFIYNERGSCRGTSRNRGSTQETFRGNQKISCREAPMFSPIKMAEKKKKVTLKYSEPSNYFPKELRKMFEKETQKKKSVKGTKKKK